MELVNLRGNTYALEDFNRIGFYVYNKDEVAVIDTGLNDESGKAIIEVCEKQGWKIKMIINTHAHPDHVGGNKIISDSLGVPIYAFGIEQIISNNPLLGLAIVSGGNPSKYMKKIFLRPVLGALPLTEEVLPSSLVTMRK